jgi:hypothetical protein
MAMGATAIPAKHPLHSLCSYLGSFPPAVPSRLLSLWFANCETILDPFCGGGTTLVEALLGGYEPIGIDLNPLAVALARAKTADVQHYDVLRRLSELARAFEPDQEIAGVSSAVSQLFHTKTLNQLLYLRTALDDKRPEDVFLRGAVLGILHGKVRKDGTTAYLSIDMPNTFSMSPNYVRGFVEEHSLVKPPADVFGKLRQRVDWLLRKGSLPSAERGMVIQGDGARAGDVLRSYEIESVDGVLTSPPYLGVLRYGAFNWIRLWFLGKDPDTVDRTLDSTDSLDRYLSFLASFLDSVSTVLDPGCRVCLVIGDVEENGRNLVLAERVWEELGGVLPFALEDLSVDDFDSAGKTTRIWGESRKGRATERDRVLVLRRD